MKASEEVYLKIAWWLPRKLAYWCAIRVGCHATQGKWGNQSPTDLLMMDALKRWEHADS